MGSKNCLAKIISLDFKMFTRRNWLLRCSILINIAVVLYICSHIMTGGGGNFATGPAYFIQDEVPKSRGVAGNILNSIEKRQDFIKDENHRKVLNAPHHQQQQQQLQQLQQQQMGNSKLYERIPDDENAPFPNDQQGDEGGGGSAGGGGGNSEAIAGDLVNNNSPQEKEISQQKQQQLEMEEQEKKNLQSLNFSDKKLPNIPTEINSPVQEKAISNDINLQTQPETTIFQNNSYSEKGTGASSNVAITTSSNVGILALNESSTGGEDKSLDERVKLVLKCNNRDYIPETLQRGDFWVLKNYVRADHGELKCHESVTYTTHADYTFLDNLLPLLERWNAPISIALHAPGTDFIATINSIKYLRDCLPNNKLVRQFVTFHIYFSTKHIPKSIPKYDKALEPPMNCSLPAPYTNISSGQLYKTQKKLLYPVNVGRNIARDSSLTHFVLASDIELYPNPGLVRKFLEMIARNDPVLQRDKPRVFPLSIFEVESSAPVPKDKTELQELLKTGKAIPFHKQLCAFCHNVPKAKEWIAANETEELGVFHIGKRIGHFLHWEPIYIGTHSDPHYDERLSWEGKSDKMTQGYALCALDYEFLILDNAFLVHKPGIKVLKRDPRRSMLAAKTNQLIKKIIYPELKVIYGTRKGCAV